jgi:hypothetical protein
MGILAGSTVKLITILFTIFGWSVETKKPAEDYEVYVNQVLREFALEMKKEYGLTCIGDRSRMPYEVSEIEVLFIAKRNATIEEARELEIKTTERFVEVINAHEKIRPFLEEYPFGANRAKVSISFKKENGRYADEGVSVVRQCRGNVCYRVKVPDSPLFESMGEEPYEEALKIVRSPQK